MIVDNAAVENLLQRFSGGAPRYTSYPSAAHFQENFSVSVAESLLQGIPNGATVSLYLHIPFCRSLCHYCGCFTRVVHDDTPIRNYLNLLEQEIDLVGRKAERRFNIGHIHFGGGSPNLLSCADVRRLLDLIEKNIGPLCNAEIAMESDPRQLSASKVKDYVAAGVNRVSLGVQDFNEDVQRAVNRVQPFAQIEECTRWLRDAGIRSINFDLIYGLPFQTAETVADNVFKAAALGADRVALFGYAHVPWMRQHQKNLEKFPLPDAKTRWEQERAAREAFHEEGYIPIGMDHFALPGDTLVSAMRAGQLRRNFQGYTTDQAQTLIASGLSAISGLPNAYVQNTSSFKFYRESLEQGRLPIEKGFVLSAEDVLRANIIEQLMCYFTIDVGELCKQHGFSPDFVDRSLEKVRSMEKDGIVETDGTVVRVSDRGQYFVRSICACFDTHIESQEKRYARAV